MNESLIDMLKIIYLGTFPHDGYDPVTNKQNGKTASSESYIFHPLTIITSLLGIPNRDLDGINEQSIGNIAKNIIGWEDNVSLIRKIFNTVKIIPTTAWNLCVSIIRFTTNMAKLVTEFIPGFIAIYAKFAAYNIYQAIPGSAAQKPASSYLWHQIKRVAFWSLYLSLEGTHYAADLALIIGRAITSPHKSVRVGWRRGLETAGDNWMGWLIGGALATASIAITVLMYALILPIAEKYAIALIVPHLPAAAMLVINHTIAFTFPVLSKIGATIFMPIVKPVFHALDITVSPAIVTMSAFAGIAITTIGTVTSKLIDDFKNWWFNCGKQKSEPHTDYRRSSSAKITSAMPANRLRQSSGNVQQTEPSTDNKISTALLSTNRNSFYGATEKTQAKVTPKSQYPYTRRML